MILFFYMSSNRMSYLTIVLYGLGCKIFVIITLTVKINTECNCEILPGKFSLEIGSREDFVTALEENNSSTMLNQFLPEVNDPSADINNLADNLSNIILNAANKTFHFKQFKRNKKRKRYKQKWFNGSPFDQPKTELKN